MGRDGLAELVDGVCGHVARFTALLGDIDGVQAVRRVLRDVRALVS